MAEESEKIKLMDKVLANQVAAGEVVERPASVIKELVENSIDAGARHIKVDITRGGCAYIKVSDDGCGMSRQDTAMSLVRHATSKLSCFEDLFNIQHMGFRGEAIPSIASVSRLSILSRRAQDVEGTLIRVEGGHAQEVQNAGCAPGTVIEVKDLFFNTPVRRKFLKSAETEAAHIEHQMLLHALCNPQIRFELWHEDSMRLDSYATKDLRQRIADLHGRDIASKLIALSPAEGPGLHLSGFIMPLAEARRNRKMQYIFLNGRPIEDKILLRAVRDGYGGLPTGLHPILYLYIKMDPGLVDVNVHPAKKEVRFRRIPDLCQAIIESITDTLRKYSQQTLDAPIQREEKSEEVYKSLYPLPKNVKLRLRPLEIEKEQKELDLPSPTASTGRASGPAPLQIKSQVPSSVAYEPVFASPPSQAPELNYALLVTRSTSAVPDFRHLGTLHDSYSIFENKDGLVLLAPRAARERLIFERLIRAQKFTLSSQQLLLPVMLELDTHNYALAKEIVPLLEKAGFRIQHKAHNTLQIDALPSLLPIDELEAFLLELLERFGEQGEIRLNKTRKPYEAFVIQLAHQYAQQEDISYMLKTPMYLLRDLLSCEIPYCTPTGKPTLVPFSMNEIKRKFHAD